MLSDEEKALSETEIRFRADLLILNSEFPTHRKTEAMEELLEIYNKQSKEIEEYKKQLDLDNECEIALNSKVMDLEKEIEELKEKNEYLPNWVSKKYVSKDKIKAKIEELDLAVFKNQTIYTVNKMQEIKFARLCLAELLEKE